MNFMGTRITAIGACHTDDGRISPIIRTTIRGREAPDLRVGTQQGMRRNRLRRFRPTGKTVSA